MKYLLAFSSTLDIDGFDGVMGLGPRQYIGSDENATNFVYELYRSRSIYRPLFSLELRDDAQFLHLGDFNKRFYPVLKKNQEKKELRWFNSSLYGFWSLRLDGI